MARNLILVASVFAIFVLSFETSWGQIKIVPLEEIPQTAAQPSPPTETTDSPSAQEKPQSISEMLAQTEGYQQGDPLTWGMVAPVIQKLRQAGMTLPPNSELQKRFLTENDPFYRMMSSRDGRQFFADLAQSPDSIDRAERYLSFKNGPKEMKFIMTRKGGAELFTDMVNTDNGRATSRMMCSDSEACDFDKPTGKIYLESQFLAFLKKAATDQFAETQETPKTAPQARNYD